MDSCPMTLSNAGVGVPAAAVSPSGRRLRSDRLPSLLRSSFGEMRGRECVRI